eukprot:augustus_masked-scaffold_7-processed-gene-15.49-mRNA-1 protein AED:0.20 eAED:0.20 QI:0/-1/0/1/-1/1/1/0/216
MKRFTGFESVLVSKEHTNGLAYIAICISSIIILSQLLITQKNPKRKFSRKNRWKGKKFNKRAFRDRVGVGIGVLILDQEGNCVVGIRKRSHGAGLLALPGGWLEKEETLEQCAIREVKEETGIEIQIENCIILDLAPSLNRFSGTKNASLTVFALCKVEGKLTPDLKEPEKCEGWFTTPLNTLDTFSKEKRLDMFPSLFYLYQNTKKINNLLNKEN